MFFVFMYLHWQIPPFALLTRILRGGRERGGESEELEREKEERGGVESEERWGKGKLHEVKGREGRRAVECQLRFILSHQNASA